ncbi:hypothetical protein [Bartonella sp. WD12.1]|uniref:hypothetical protein n=1 Tax=Bartonella sp. WD12.1 TaxID=1933903 RepID=UPI0009D5053C|nr:hypothetical protein [Bartonella sp. WD12.1]OPB30183.1 hypothetical protein BWD121_012350 [Bartonella sp. WD12.1]
MGSKRELVGSKSIGIGIAVGECWGGDAGGFGLRGWIWRGNDVRVKGVLKG